MAGVQKCYIFGCLDSFRYDAQSGALTHADNRAHDGYFVGRVGDLANERLIEFVRIEGEHSQVAQAGITGAKVVDRDLHSFLTELPEDGCVDRWVSHQDVLGNFQFERFRIHGGIALRCEKTFHEVFVAKLDYGDVHRHRSNQQAVVRSCLSLSARFGQMMRDNERLARGIQITEV
jgi:hypothetical protein